MDTPLSAWQHPTSLLPTPAHHARALLTVLAQPDDAHLGQALDALGPEHVLALIGQGCASQPGDRPAERSRVPEWARRAAHRWTAPEVRAVLDNAAVPEDATTAGARFIIPSDAQWPTRLNQLGHRRPYGLWVWGGFEDQAALLAAPAVSIIGSREATSYGTKIAGELSSSLNETGWVTVSGGALGIDAAAHHGSLERAVPTLAMLPCGVDVVYPPEHQVLFAQVRRHGLLVSEVGPGRRASRALFFARNRMVACSLATVVVEARLRSGTMHTSDQVMRLSGRLLAVPGPITSPVSAGPNRLIATGAADMVTRSADLPRLLPERH